MSTTPVAPGPGGPTIPLTPEVRKAYEDHYVDYENAIENTAEPLLKASLMASQYAVEAVISADNKAKIDQTTAAFAALLKQINTTNKGLDELQKQIRKVAGDISMYGAILGGIAKVLTLVPVA